MWSDQNNTDEEPQLDIDDIQGDILVGLPKDFEWFLFFTIEKAEAFKKFARVRLTTRITSTAQVLAWQGASQALQTLKGSMPRPKLPLIGLNMAFTIAGLAKLGVPGKAGDRGGITEADPFNRGMANQKEELDGVLLITGPTEEAVDRVREELNNNRDGWRVLGQVCGNTRPHNRGHEHFGFLDSISQPAIRGRVDRVFPGRQFLDLDRSPGNPAQGLAGSPLIWPGEFVFGYPTATKNAQSPDGPGERADGGAPWTRNGSLLVITRFKQFVPEFNKFFGANELTAARMVGRWKSGAPLMRAPISDNPAMGADRLRNNDFDFEGDQVGGRCPLGAHIRKVYPRDSANTYSHRLIRRGIPFGREVSPEEMEGGKTTDERGLMFVCYQTSIKEQFEYVNGLMKGIADNSEDSDALVGQSAQRLIQATYGGYFFMPSISTFKNIVAEDSHERPMHPTLSLRKDGRIVDLQLPLLKDGKLAPLYFDQAEVQQVFRRLRDLFNSGDYDSMRPLLDPNLTWKMIHHSDSFTGVDDVLRWLKEKKTSLRPQFLPPEENPPNLGRDIQQTVLTGDGSVLISGRVGWKESVSVTEANVEPIKYYLTFTKQDGRWFLSHAFAVRLFPNEDGKKATGAKDTTADKIRKVLERLEQRLNAAQYKEMQPDLDPNITWKMIHHAESIKGAPKVIKWLEDSKALLRPQFELIDVQAVAPNLDGTYRLTGRAKWRPSESSPLIEEIEYHFTFLKSGDSWLLNNAFATVVDVKVDPPPSKG